MAHFHMTFLTLLLVFAVGFYSVKTDAACCTKYSGGDIPVALLKGYSIQTKRGRCNINAIIFHTIRDRHLCADPTQIWVMERIQRLRDRVRKMTSKNNTAVAP